MGDFFNEFEGSSEQQWLDRLTSDLKGKSPQGILDHEDKIEEVLFSANKHHSQNKWSDETPGSLPYTRTGKLNDNSWIINNYISGKNAKEINTKALYFLMKGATGITIDLKHFSIEECQEAIKEIGIEYIHITFYYSTTEQFHWLKELKSNRKLMSASFINSNESNFGLIEGVRNFLIDASQVQKSGGNNAQEIAFALYKGHEKLFELLESGCKVDDAVALLKFRFGIGSNYFFEIAKYRCFRRLWAEIILAYKPKHDCSAVPFIEAETSSLNKSLRDPYTNLLRLTTESLSAMLGGIDELTIHPFDVKSDSKKKDKHQRLGNNIALILQDESYMHLVIDPAGGSYSIEQLTIDLSNKAWELFQYFNFDEFKISVKEKADLRIKLIEEKTMKKVGINHFMSEQDHPGEWNAPEYYEIGTELILERDCKIEQV